MTGSATGAIMGQPLRESSVISKALASSFFLILIWVVCAAFGISGSDPILEQRSEIAYTQFKRIVAEGIVSPDFSRGACASRRRSG